MNHSELFALSIVLAIGMVVAGFFAGWGLIDFIDTIRKYVHWED